MTAFDDGRTIAITERNLLKNTLRRLKSEQAFWQGFHDYRPVAPDLMGVSQVEDPTRPGGWCFATRGLK